MNIAFFLQQLDSLRIKEQFIRITVLNWKEEPLQTIQGISINGSVNLDGNSSMRRTASLTVFAEEKENNLANIDQLFAINKKCKIELGIVNTVQPYTIEMKDSNGRPYFQTMNYQQLYGDIVWFPLGIYVMFNPSVAHSLTGVTISMQLKDKMCLLNGDLGGEIHSAVEFNNQDERVDINSVSLEKNPVLIYNIIKQLVNHWGNEQFHKIIISEVPFQIKAAVKWNGKETAYFVDNAENPMLFLTKEEAEEWQKQYPGQIKDFKTGKDIGFVYTDFTYPGELSCAAGDTVTSVLDKIIGIMGNYEYFYDVEGNFVFQEKQNYLNMTNTAYWAKEQNAKVGNLPSEVYEADMYRLSRPVYNFIHNQFTTAYNNTLNFNNIKNDFVVWGSYPSSKSNSRIPCRFHLAIDKKPQLNSHYVILFTDNSQVVRAVAAHLDITGQPIQPEAEEKISKDWREEIYYQMLESEKLGTDENTEINNPYFQYYAELKEEFPKIYDLNTQTYKIDMEQNPNEIGYFLDFIDEDSELGQYSVSNIGRRAKIIGDNNEGINCVFEPYIPDYVYIDIGKYTDEEIKKLRENLISYGQRFIQVSSSLASLFDIGGSLNSCFEKIKDLLYQYTHVNNTISITSLPIYYLEPNTRITVEDAPAGIYGDYIIQSISLPLDVSSTMTINAYKALQKI